ncbi:MAG: chemotaxis protein CheW [Polyangiales bacterium]|nr:chemotaxis protein CheW [Myxococcales bacterium]
MASAFRGGNKIATPVRMRYQSRDAATLRGVGGQMAELESQLSLLCRANGRTCAFPLSSVVEIMRPLPVVPVAEAPGYVDGIAIIRGEPTPVVRTAKLVGGQDEEVARFVTLRAGSRFVALAVESVLGVRGIPTRILRELPPLLRDTASDAVDRIGVLDAELVAVLGHVTWLPESVFEATERVADDS